MPSAHSQLSVIKEDLRTILRAMDALAKTEKIDLLEATSDLEDAIFEVQNAQDRIFEAEEKVYRDHLAQLQSDRDEKLRSMGIRPAPWNEIEVK